jgi:ATP phosphoribosyltransferase-like protein
VARVSFTGKRFEGYLTAQRYSMVYYNIEKSKLVAAAAVTPGRRAPSVTDLSPAPGSVGADTPADTCNTTWVALSAMVLKDEVNNIMDELTTTQLTDAEQFLQRVVNKGQASAIEPVLRQGLQFLPGG